MNSDFTETLKRLLMRNEFLDKLEGEKTDAQESVVDTTRRQVFESIPWDIPDELDEFSERLFNPGSGKLGI